MIRKATTCDASRIAEISIFTKRMNYRKIFHNDKVSFGEMQVYPLAKNYIDNPAEMDGMWVYDDEFVKGYINVDKKTVKELYVDSFFEGRGIGGQLLEFAITSFDCDNLWVLEENLWAKSFYISHGFFESGKRKPEGGTDKYIIELIRKS